MCVGWGEGEVGRSRRRCGGGEGVIRLELMPYVKWCVGLESKSLPLPLWQREEEGGGDGDVCRSYM